MPLFRRRPPEPDPERTEIVTPPPPAGPVEGETVARTPVDEVVVPPPPRDTYVEEQVVEERPYRRGPTDRELWPWLLLLLLLVLGGLAALWYFTREDEPDRQPVPGVVRLQEAEAVDALDEAGFEPRVRRQPSERAQRGIVFAQQPGAGSEAEENSIVTVLVSTGPATATVPNVVGIRAEQAVDRLERAGLRARQRGVFSEEPRGVVIAQDPPAGERTRRGTSVRVNVSRGTGRVTVPDVLGLTLAQAQAELRDVGLTAKRFDVPSDAPRGTVVAQNPQPGTQIAKGDAVRVNVSTGEGAGGGTDTTETTETTDTTDTTETATDGAQPPPPARPATVRLPSVTGQTVDAAQNRLQNAGFVVRVVFVASRQPEGTVISQTPAAGASVRRGSNVRLNVSEGPRPRARRAVPDVVALTQREATAELRRLGFRIRVFREPTPDPAEEGLVIRQEPSAGTRARTGSVITVYIGEFTG